MASARSGPRAPLGVLTASLRIGARLLLTGVVDAASTQLRRIPAATSLAAGGAGHVVRSLQEESSPLQPRGEVGEFAFQIALVISQMRQEEFILFLATVVPLTYGLLAFLRYLTGARSDAGEADSDDHHKHHKLELTKLARRHKDATEMITRRMEKDMQELQARLDSVEQGQESKLNELHKDLANTYWQVTKLRSDLSRVTPNSPFKGRCLSSAASAVALSTEAQIVPEASVPDGGSNEEARLGSSKSAGGAHVWRS